MALMGGAVLLAFATDEQALTAHSGVVVQYAYLFQPRPVAG
jgi:hypothetical protein